jgi:hypothetical protein
LDGSTVVIPQLKKAATGVSGTWSSCLGAIPNGVADRAMNAQYPALDLRPACERVVALVCFGSELSLVTEATAADPDPLEPSHAYVLTKAAEGAGLGQFSHPGGANMRVGTSLKPMCGGAALAFLSAMSSSNAGIVFCNQFAQTVFVAIAYPQDGGSWMAEPTRMTHRRH